GQTIEAEIDVDGLDPACQRRAKGQTRILPGFKCPTITVRAIGNGSDNEPIAFTAKLEPGTPDVTYNWTVTAGVILAGQGTPDIQVSPQGLAGQRLTATVDVGGLPAN